MSTRIYYYAESLSRTTTSTTDYSAVKVTQAFLPNANKTYAIFWSVLLDNSVSTNWKKARLQNTTAGTTLAETIIESLSASTSDTDKSIGGGVALYTAPASPASQTIEIQYASANAATTVAAQEASVLILELIDDVDIWASSAGVTNISSTTYSTKVGLSWTPGSSGDYLVIGAMEGSIGSSNPRARLNINNGTLYNVHESMYDGVAGNWYPYVAAARMVNISGANTAWFEHSSSAASQTSVRNAHAVALRMDQFDAHFWGEDRTVHNSTSGTYADSATTGAVTPVAVPHIVLAVGDTTASAPSTTVTGVKINGAGSDIGTNFIQNVGYSGYWWSCFQIRSVTPAASSQTWKTQYARTASTGTATSDEHVIALMQLEADVETSFETLAPDTIAASTNLTGAVTAIDEDPDSPDANWLTATSAVAATDVRVTFPTPSGTPYGAQNFRVQLRKTTGTPTPTVDVMLYQGGSSVATLLNDQAITSTSGQVVQGDWTASQLTGTLDGSDVECRIVSVVGSSSAAGTLPAYSSAGTLFDSATMPQTNLALNSPAHAVGDLLIAFVACRNTNTDGLLSSVNGTGGTTGWTLQNNAGSMYGGARNCRIGFGWKIATSTSEVCSITTSGGTSADRIHARVYKFTAADGFAATPITAIGTETADAGTTITMPSVAAGGANELAVALIGSSVSSTIADATGETGGDWTEPVAEDATTNCVTAIQVSDQSGGGAISGGTITITNGSWVAIGFRLVPAQLLTAVNTVEVGAVEWNVQYEGTGAVSISPSAHSSAVSYGKIPVVNPSAHSSAGSYGSVPVVNPIGF